MLLLTLAVDSSSKAPSAKPALTSKTTSACAAVTTSDVEDTLGQFVGLGESEASSSQSTCTYSANGGQISVTVGHVGERLNAAMEIEALKTNFPTGKIRELTGIGVRAFFLDIPGAGVQLNVLRGEHDYLMVSVLGFGAVEKVSAAAEKMARRALERL
jgi:hypothetical protein